MKLGEILTRTAGLFPDNPAVIHQDERITYRDLESASNKLARHLKDLNLPEGSRIGIFLENSADYVVAFFGVTKAGFVVVPLDTSLNHEKLYYIVSDCQAEVLIVHARFQRMLAKFFEMKPALKYIISDKQLKFKLEGSVCSTFDDVWKSGPEGTAAGDSPAGLTGWDEAHRAPKDLAAIFYTSGSTGQGKGVMLSHRNLISNTVGTIEYLKLTSNDSVIVILPFYYIYGNSLLLTHAAVGGTLVIDNRFMYAEVVLDTMQNERVTGFSGVPSNFMILLNNSTLPQRKFPALRYFTQAGGAMAPEVQRRLYDIFSDKEIYIMYGQTEASPRVTWLPPHRLPEKIGSIGIEVPGLLVKIIKENGREAVPDEEGEIVVGGDSVMMGYWNQPEEQKEVLRDGWLYTGDLARRDQEGFIYIVGRKKEIIKSGGNRISVKEVEECLLTNEKIHEVAVFGVKDDIFGEAVKAVIVLKTGQQAEIKEIQRFVRERLAEYKVPRYVEFIDSLPKYQSGKINKVALRQASA